MTEPPQPGQASALRSDVRRNRAALIAAAREVFAADADAPMYEVARRAGVGQATLYRHFPDRSALAGAVAEQLVDQIERIAGQAAGKPGAFDTLLRAYVEAAADAGDLVSLLYTDSADAGAELQRLRARLAAAFASALQDAKTVGMIRDDTTLADLMIILRMIKGALDNAPGGPGQRRTLAERALTLVIDGLAPRDPIPDCEQVQAGRGAGGARAGECAPAGRPLSPSRVAPSSEK
jgi:AcrR family transcriptional regulator